MPMHRNAGRSVSYLVALATLGLLALAGCAQERPVAPVSLAVPTQLGVNTTDVTGVYAATRQYLESAGLKTDRSFSDTNRGEFVSKPARCAPNGDERHVAMCVFTAIVAPSRTNPLQVAVEVKVRPGAMVKFDPNLARDQIRIEPTLDGIVTALRARFTFAEVTQSGSLSF